MDIQKTVIPQFIGKKAGMEQLDRQAIAKKIAQITQGTPKDLHEKQLQRKRNLQITEMLQKIAKYKQKDREELKQQWQKKMQRFQEERVVDRYWAHFDFDMFFVACELLDKENYKNLPCAVGGENSVLCTANYAARVYGVGSAMPTFIAKKLCPELILFKPNFQKYRKYSDIFRDILRRFDNQLESMGLDEAYLDLTNNLKNQSIEKQRQLMENIRNQIYDKTKLTVSCGVGANKLLAKMASQMNKPNGLFILQNNKDIILNFMKQKKVRKMYGIGKVNQYYLRGLGIQTAKDILQKMDILSICFSSSSCQFFLSSAMGIGPIQHQFKQRKSLGKSQTFKPCSTKQYLQQKLLSLCQQVQHQLQQQGYVTINVVFSYQTQNYQKKDKTFNLDQYTSIKENLFNVIYQFFNKQIIFYHKNVRYMGVKCTNLMKSQLWKKKCITSYFSKIKEKEREVKSAKKMDNYEIDEEKEKESKSKSQHSASHSSKLMMNEIKQKSQFICPICNVEIACMSNLSAFNRHIDKCLKGVK